jgi:F-type H+-transporting ATPase subunit delta
MTSRAAAGRYARALFDVSKSEGADLQRVERELSGFAEIIAGNDLLHRVLTNPAVPAPKKRAAVEQLIDRVGGLLGPVSKLLLMLAERDRLAILPDLVEGYRSRLRDHLKIVRAEVVTAAPLAADRVDALREGLARATGRQVQLDTRVDAAIVGGAVARLGSTVFDGSITRQLEKMKETLVSAAE